MEYSEKNNAAQEIRELERWTPQDGTKFGNSVERMIADYDRSSEGGISVETQAAVTKGGDAVPVTGYIDVLVDNQYVIDIKTDNMQEWKSEAHAYRVGRDYGIQVNEYVQSPDVSPLASGHLLMCGNENPDHKVAARMRDAFQRGAAEYCVHVTFFDERDTFEPATVVNHIRDRFIERSKIVESTTTGVDEIGTD